MFRFAGGSFNLPDVNIRRKGMKKVLYVAFAVFVLSVMCFTVMPARAEVTFNGEWRVRGFAFDIDGTKDADVTNNYWDQRFRLYITAKISDNLKGIIRAMAPNHAPCDFAIGNDDAGSDPGNKWGTSVDPRPVLWDIAYLDFTCPITEVNIKLGRQGIDLGNMIVLGSCKTYDALVLGKKIQNVGLSLFTAKFYEGTTSQSDDEDLYGVNLNFNPVPNMNASVFAVMANDGATYKGYHALFEDENALANAYPDMDAYWFGATANMDIAPVKVKLEFDYSTLTFNSQLDGVDDVEAKGFAFFGDVSADLPAVKVGGNILYTTGDDADAEDTNESDLFIPISSYFSERNDYDYIVMRTFLYKPTVDFDAFILPGDWSIGNLTAFQLYAYKDLMPKLTGKLSVQKYMFTEDPDGSEDTFGDDLGMEVDVKLTYKMLDNLTITGVGAYWLTTDDIFQKDNEDCWLLKHEILYKF
jgi:hypothetical protein